jgi:hypothetical protein
MKDQWLRELASKGFAICRGIVPPELIEHARAVVEEQLASDLREAGDEQIKSWTNRTFVPAIETDNRLLDLYQRSPLAAMSQEALAPYALTALERAQVQVRFSRKTPASKAQPLKDWHCDGIACPHLPPGRLNTFQLLVGILLTDLPQPEGGAVRFRVGGHRSVASAFRANSRFPEGLQVPAPVLELPIEAMCGSAGDAIISHHMAPHAVGVNETNTDRLMAYFRLRVVDHESIARLQLTDPWIRMPRLAAIEEAFHMEARGE